MRPDRIACIAPARRDSRFGALSDTATAWMHAGAVIYGQRPWDLSFLRASANEDAVIKYNKNNRFDKFVKIVKVVEAKRASSESQERIDGDLIYVDGRVRFRQYRR